MKIIHVIETMYEGRVITVGASLSEETIERRLEEIKKNNPGRSHNYWSSTYCLTDDFTPFDWI
jgi:hypothetical protein